MAIRRNVVPMVATAGGVGVAVVNSVTFTNASTLQVSITVATDAATGARDLTATNPGTGPGGGRNSAGDACAGCLTVA